MAISKMNHMENRWMHTMGKIIINSYGLLRFNNKSEKISLQVNVEPTISKNGAFHVVVKDGEFNMKLVNQNANFIQRTGNGYLFVTGYISSIIKYEKSILLLDVLKACLFVRKRMNHSTWLEETCLYEQLENR